MKELLTLIDECRTAWDEWSSPDDDFFDLHVKEIEARCDRARAKLLAHRPANLAEVAVKAAFMTSCAMFTEWDDMPRHDLIEAFLPVGDLCGPAPATVQMTPEPAVLLQKIEDFARAHGIAAATVGRKAANDGKLVARLRAGKRCWPETAAKVMAYIEAGRP